MKSEPTMIFLPTTLTAEEIKIEIRYAFPQISRLRVTTSTTGVIIAWTARKYSKADVETHLQGFIQQQAA